MRGAARKGGPYRERCQTRWIENRPTRTQCSGLRSDSFLCEALLHGPEQIADLVRSKYSCGFPIFDVGVDPGNV